MDNLKIALICVVLFSITLALIFVLLTISATSKCEDCDELPLWLTLEKSIIEVAPDQQNNYVVVSTNSRARVVDFYYEKKEIFWAEELGNSTIIYSYWLGRAGTKRVPAQVRTLAEAPHCTGLAVDWHHDHLYWALTAGMLEVSTLQGSHRRLVYTNSSTSIIAIAVDPLNRQLFWMEKIKLRSTSKEHQLQIKSSTLKGSEVNIIVQAAVWRGKTMSRGSLSLDLQERRLYYLLQDGILQGCNYKGGDMNIVAGVPAVASVSLSKRQIFWMNAGDVYTRFKDREEVYHHLTVCGHCTDSQKEEVLSQKTQIKVIDSRNQPEVPRRRKIEECLFNYNNFTEICPCPFGYRNQKRPRENACKEDGFLLATFESSIQGIDTKGSTMIMHYKRDAKIPAVDFHFLKGHLFWYDAEDGRIYKGRLFDLSERRTVALLAQGTTALAVDWLHDHLYWTHYSARGGTVLVCRLDGSTRTQLTPRSTAAKLVSMALDPHKGLMYLANWAEGSIETLSLDGTDRLTLVPGGLVRPRSLTIDWRGPDATQLFWLESDQSQTIIKGCFLQNGVSCREVHSGRGGAVGLTLLDNRLYWIDVRGLNHISLDTGTTKITHLPPRFKMSGSASSLRAYHSRLQPPGRGHCRLKWCRRDSLCLPRRQGEARCVRKAALSLATSYSSNSQLLSDE